MKLHHRAAVMALLTLAVAILTLFTARLSSDSGHRIAQAESAVSGVHDFDFLVGSWRVHHRKLKQRLVNNHDWVEFEGTLVMRKLMDGYSNVDDDVFEVPGGAYRGVALRSFDTKTQRWSIWWLDSRTPQGPLDPPVRGSFQNGVGTFYADDTWEGKPVRIRFIWSKITPTSCQWEQAFSTDKGVTWETNWVQDIQRVR